MLDYIMAALNVACDNGPNPRMRLRLKLWLRL